MSDPRGDRRRRCFDRRIEPCHGRRKDYQQGCRCRRCRGANAAYQSEFRAKLQAGTPPLGRHIPAMSTWRLIRQLLSEFTKADVAQAISASQLPDPRLRVHPKTVTVRTYLRVHRLYRTRMAE